MSNYLSTKPEEGPYLVAETPPEEHRAHTEPCKEPPWAAQPFWREAQNKLDKTRADGKTRLVMDLQSIERVAYHGDGPAYELMNAMVSINDTEGYEGYKGAPRALLALLASLAEASEKPLGGEIVTPIGISTTPPSAPELRRAGRLLSMVHELHKAGYQRLRICAGKSYDKTHWRCILFTADNVLADGWTPLNAGSCIVYSTEDEKKFFGWEDADSDDARKLAIKFIERFPDTARAASGMDWAYAGWFTSILGAAEHGRLPVFYEGMESEKPSETALPPPSPIRAILKNSGTGHEPITNESLRVENLPRRGASYEEMVPFCLSFDGDVWKMRTGASLETVADAAERKGLQNCSMNELRVTAFYRQRQAKWHDWAPVPERLIESIRAAVEAIRVQLSMGTA